MENVLNLKLCIWNSILNLYNLFINFRCWEEVKIRSNYSEEAEKVEKFNSENRWKKRGISLIPTKFGISFTAKHLNQAGALVQVKI